MPYEHGGRASQDSADLKSDIPRKSRTIRPERGNLQLRRVHKQAEVKEDNLEDGPCKLAAAAKEKLDAAAASGTSEDNPR